MSNRFSSANCYHFNKVLLKEGWLDAAYVVVDEDGIITHLSAEPPKEYPIDVVNGVALPGFQNCHSHAFQYAMAGLAEIHDPGTNDDFWSWREAMYQCALSMDPDQVQTVATALYTNLLKNGYTNVVEFHYLHHDKNGKPYENAAEMSVALVAAASIAGIKITLTPVHYRKGGFGIEAQPRQRRFLFKDVDDFLKLLESASAVAGKVSTATMGFGVHSLRAVEAEEVKQVLHLGPKNLPFHLHAAEQLKEVEDCKAVLKSRPVEWLLNNVDVNDRFNIVHCTHLSDAEVEGLAKSKANVVLCPGTEGNLGDGIFRLSDFVKFAGNWCIGTDSHISLNPLEDLRWLDYAQRLVTHKRNTFHDGGLTMLSTAFFNGVRSGGWQKNNFFEIGKPLDAVVFDDSEFAGSTTQLLSQLFYTADSRKIVGTIVNGKWIVKDYNHHEDEKTRDAFKKVVKAISGS